MQNAIIPTLAVSLLLVTNAVTHARDAVFTSPSFFSSELKASWSLPNAMAFAPNASTLFVAEISGRVRVFVNDAQQPNGLFLDLHDEVNSDTDRGMLGMTVDPNYAVNKFVYFIYTVDPIFGPPNESSSTPSFSRVTRYTATPSGGGIIGTNRLVLIGNTSADGIPSCYFSHATCGMAFGPDGKLLVANGDSTHFEFADGGGNTPGCVLGSGEDIGSFRAQDLDSLNGKILRVNPANGQGLPDNPFFTGNVADKRSRVFISGLRNPFRFCLKPESTGQGTLVIGDVGWNTREEITFATGGDNCGWPCFEAANATTDFSSFHNSWDCSTLNTPSNPGPLRNPAISWHHSNPALSIPPGPTGVCAIGGVFYTGNSYPLAYHNTYFYADYTSGWIRCAKFTATNQLIQTWEFAHLAGGPVAFAADPLSNDLYYVALDSNTLYRVSYSGPGTGDVNGDFSVNISDLTEVILHWGACPGGPPVCPADIDGDGDVDIVDLTNVILHWS